MNFKPTKLKFVISIIVALIVGILFLSRIPCLDCSAEEMRALSNQQFLIGFIVSLFLVYSIWSLFQKKNDKKISVWFYIIAVIIIVLIALLIFFSGFLLQKFF